ncbi:MAG: DUF1684 domain-containing protein, partial [Anaerolineae bacterium]|nr:DUF1684 domain-containing protein [Anaerolineae bacterium]
QRGTHAPESFAHFRETRDQLFGKHSQSALTLEQRQHFQGLRYYDYDPAYRVTAAVEVLQNPASYEIDAGDDGSVIIQEIGRASFTLPTGTGSLGIFWITGYGGGIFIPFRDLTNGDTTYGGGRYLLDTIKGADLGAEEQELILDFNYAYHPSCYYNPRWTCPLAPMQNRLPFPIFAGEKKLEP